MSHTYIDKLIKYFVEEVRYGRSIDWYLIKLSSTVSSIEDLCRNNVCDPRELFKDFINDYRVRNSLKPLACNKDVVEKNVLENPRFRNLRKYLEMLVEVLNSIECSREEARGVETIERPATWRLESEEYISRKREKEILLRKLRRKRFSIALDIGSKITLISLIMFVIVIVLLILKIIGWF